MKLALISGGLFLLSYIALNRGLGPQPRLQVVNPPPRPSGNKAKKLF